MYRLGLFFVLILFWQCGQDSTSTDATLSEPVNQAASPIEPNSAEAAGCKFSALIDLSLFAQSSGQAMDRAKYLELANRFNPSKWNPSELVSNLKSNGIQRVLFNVKGPDGFCLFNTQHTDFNAVDLGSYGTDLFQELTSACTSNQMEVGIVYSLADWNHSEGSPPDELRAGPISANLETYYSNQLQELLTSYGDIAQILFTDGSPTPAQSVKLRQLIKSLQPTCTISSTLQNDQGDFVLLDYPLLAEVELNVPWQVIAPFSGSTGKANAESNIERLVNELLRTNALGGNYSIRMDLNDQGALQQDQLEALALIRGWISNQGAQFYTLKPSDFGAKSWGYVTDGGDQKLVIHITQWPSDGSLSVYGLNNPVTSITPLENQEQDVPFAVQGKNIRLNLNGQFTKQYGITTLVLTYQGELSITPLKMAYAQAGKWRLTPKNAVERTSWSSINSYAGMPVANRLTWYLPPTVGGMYSVKMNYTRQETGKNIKIKVGERIYDFNLGQQNSEEIQKPQEVIYGNFFLSTPPYSGELFTTLHGPTKGFPTTEKWGYQGEITWTEQDEWRQGETWTINTPGASTVYLYQSMYSSIDQTMMSAFGSELGFALWSNGDFVAQILTPDGNKPVPVLLEVPLNAGNNQLMYKFINADASLDFSVTHDVLAARFHQMLNPAIELEQNAITTIELWEEGNTIGGLGLYNFSLEVTPER